MYLTQEIRDSPFPDASRPCPGRKSNNLAGYHQKEQKSMFHSGFVEEIGPEFLVQGGLRLEIFVKIMGMKLGVVEIDGVRVCM